MLAWCINVWHFLPGYKNHLNKLFCLFTNNSINVCNNTSYLNNDYFFQKAELHIPLL